MAEEKLSAAGVRPSPEIERLNLEIAQLVGRLSADDMVEILSGRVSSLLRADDNQNQNQNGSRVPRASDKKG